VVIDAKLCRGAAALVVSAAVVATSAAWNHAFVSVAIVPEVENVLDATKKEAFWLGLR
jgi:hypothetical protein